MTALILRPVGAALASLGLALALPPPGVSRVVGQPELRLELVARSGGSMPAPGRPHELSGGCSAGAVRHFATQGQQPPTSPAKDQGGTAVRGPNGVDAGCATDEKGQLWVVIKKGKRLRRFPVGTCGPGDCNVTFKDHGGGFTTVCVLCGGAVVGCFTVSPDGHIVRLPKEEEKERKKQPPGEVRSPGADRRGGVSADVQVKSEDFGAAKEKRKKK